VNIKEVKAYHPEMCGLLKLKLSLLPPEHSNKVNSIQNCAKIFSNNHYLIFDRRKTG